MIYIILTAKKGAVLFHSSNAVVVIPNIGQYLGAIFVVTTQSRPLNSQAIIIS